MTYEEAVKEVYYWQYENNGSFYNMLLFLFQKADGYNQHKLGVAYPSLYLAYLDWCVAGEYGNELFKKHGLMK